MWVLPSLGGHERVQHVHQCVCFRLHNDHCPLLLETHSPPPAAHMPGRAENFGPNLAEHRPKTGQDSENSKGIPGFWESLKTLKSSNLLKTSQEPIPDQHPDHPSPSRSFPSVCSHPAVLYEPTQESCLHDTQPARLQPSLTPSQLSSLRPASCSFPSPTPFQNSSPLPLSLLIHSIPHSCLLAPPPAIVTQSHTLSQIFSRCPPLSDSLCPFLRPIELGGAYV